MAAQVQPLPIPSTVQHEERRRAVESALGTTLAEGVSPGPEVLAFAERYIDGEITLQEFGCAVRTLSGI
jgi:hypothetical protein